MYTVEFVIYTYPIPTLLAYYPYYCILPLPPAPTSYYPVPYYPYLLPLLPLIPLLRDARRLHSRGDPIRPPRRGSWQDGWFCMERQVQS
jgi:hypothetical protein